MLSSDSQCHMSIEYIYMFFLLNVFPCALSDVLLDQQYIGIENIYIFFHQNVF